MRTLLFAFAACLSAALAFMVQPMVGKAILPLLGGTPAVWNTCLVFFQIALLLGYRYADWGAALRPPVQARWHLLALSLPFAWFAAGIAFAGSPVPVVASLLPTSQDNPILPLLGVLALAIGLPFIVLSTTAPLLQRWHGGDAYALYAASNAGSLLGLLSYPVAIEPWLGLESQAWAWAAACAAALAILGVCAFLAADAPPSPPGAAVPAGAFLRWAGLAALPSALLTAVTTLVTSDVAPVPMLWVVPLALYLISFIVVFAAWPKAVHERVWRLSVMLVLFAAMAVATRAGEFPLLLAVLHLAAFGGVCLVCHGELVRDKPPPEGLTSFYLALSVGGVAGGLAAGLLAPIIFSRVGFAEYPLALVLACLVRPREEKELASGWGDVVVAAILGGTALALVQLLPEWKVRGGIAFGVPLIAAFAMARWRVRFALSVGAVLLASALDPGMGERTLWIERDFFGVLRVAESRDGRFRILYHGSTQHGQQAMEDRGKPRPLMYYHRTSPIGRLLRALPPERTRRVGAVGLGCGSLAAYSRPGEHWTFIEIDPAVERIAREWFDFLRTAEGETEVVLGDARRRLAESEEKFDVLVLDAFSGDAIPVHLLTREALQLYLDRLAPGGVIAFHVSNRYLDLPPLLARLAQEQGLAMRVDSDTNSDTSEGIWGSEWLALARSEADLEFLKKGFRWQPFQGKPGPAWTDQYSNLLGVWRTE